MSQEDFGPLDEKPEDPRFDPGRPGKSRQQVQDEEFERREKERKKHYDEMLAEENRLEHELEYMQELERMYADGAIPELIHVFVPDAAEDYFQAIEPQFENFYVHRIPTGTLWGAVQERFPDIEFYEATHPELIESLKTGSTQNLENRPEPKAQRRYEAGAELTED